MRLGTGTLVALIAGLAGSAGRAVRGLWHTTRGATADGGGQMMRKRRCAAKRQAQMGQVKAATEQALPPRALHVASALQLGWRCVHRIVGAVLLGMVLVSAAAPVAARAADVTGAADASTASDASAPSADAAGQASAGADQASVAFDAPFTAWAGYATTQGASFVPGTTPVAAPMQGAAVWTFDATGAGRDAGALAADARAAASAAESSDELLESRRSAPAVLRQIGQNTYLYVLGYDAIYKLDSATGEEVARADLGTRAPRDAQLAFVDSVLVVPTDAGGLVAFDEDLNKAWTSPSAGMPRVADGWNTTSQIVERAGCIVVAFSAEQAPSTDNPAGAAEAMLAAFSSFDGSVLWAGVHAAAGALSLEDGAGVESATSESALTSSTSGATSTSSVAGAAAVATGSDAADGAAQALAMDDGAAHIGGAYLSVFVVDDNHLLVSYGGPTLMLVDSATGALVSTLVLDGPVAARIAAPSALAGGAGSFVVATSQVSDGGTATSSIIVVHAADGVLSASDPLPVEGYVRAVRPVCVGTTAIFVLDTDPADTVLSGDVELQAIGCSAAFEGAESVPAASASLPSSADPAPAAAPAPELARTYRAPGIAGGLAVAAYGTTGDNAVIELIYPAESGGVCQITYALVDGFASAEAQTHAHNIPAVFGAASTPVINRDGSVVLQVGEAIVAFAADPARAVDTMVGGSVGLDTIAGVLTGITLPNGAGLGVGVVIFALAFGAYRYIRTRGIRRAPRDEWESPGPSSGSSSSSGGRP